MKKIFKSLLMSALVLTAGAFVACTDKGEEETVFEGIPEISAVADAAGVTLDGGVVKINVTSNAPWTATATEGVTLSKKKGNGDAVVNVTIPASTEARDIQVVFTATGLIYGQEMTDDATVNIFQNASGALMISGITPDVVGSGAEFSLENVLVVATGTQAYVIADESGAMLVFHSDHGRTVGEKINISGEVTVYTSASGSVGTPQFANSATVEVVSTGNEVTHNPTVVSGADFDALKDEPMMQEVEFTGKWIVSGTYVNITVEGATYQGSTKYINNAEYAEYAEMSVVVKGYTAGFSKSGDNYFINVMPYSVEADPNQPWLKVDKSELVFDADETSRQTFTITTNDFEGYTLSWAIDNEADFAIGRQIPGGNSRATLYCYPKAANTGATKSATVTVTYSNGTNTLTKKVSVKQQGVGESIAEFDFSTLYADQERATEVGTKTVDGITLAWNKGENGNAAKIYDGVVRAYATNTFALSGAAMSNIEVTYESYTDPNTVSANVGVYTDGVPTGIWAGSASEVIFTIDKKDPNSDSKAGQRRIKKIVVTYVAAN